MAIDWSKLAQPKPEPRKRAKARADRQEAAVKRAVRAEVEARDGYCRWQTFDAAAREAIQALIGPCSGPSEWAHLEKRWSTKGMEPELRHSSAGSCMMCRAHHQSDRQGFDRHIYDVEAVTPKGADGQLRIVMPNGRTWQEAA